MVWKFIVLMLICCVVSVVMSCGCGKCSCVLLLKIMSLGVGLSSIVKCLGVSVLNDDMG